MRQWILHSYLAKLYADFRLLFLLVIILIAGTVFQALKSREEFPLLLYGMYSLPEKPKSDYVAYSIVLEGKEVVYASLWDAQRELIQSPLSHWVPLLESQSLSATDAEKYKAWLFRYASDMRMTEEYRMEVYRLSCIYNTAGLPTVTDRKLLFTYLADGTR
ncbi:MAG: hypothetical protein IPN22_09280 [Bacteroidetes bacterium]|nr:hypothetical protein [Bacteroidota bacterium]